MSMSNQQSSSGLRDSGITRLISLNSSRIDQCSKFKSVMCYYFRCLLQVAWIVNSSYGKLNQLLWFALSFFLSRPALYVFPWWRMGSSSLWWQETVWVTCIFTSISRTQLASNSSHERHIPVYCSPLFMFICSKKNGLMICMWCFFIEF